MGLLEHDDGAASDVGEPAAACSAARLIGQPGGSVLVEALLPEVEGMLGQADQGGEVAGGQAAAPPGIEDEQALWEGELAYRLRLGADESSSPGQMLKPGQRTGEIFVDVQAGDGLLGRLRCFLVNRNGERVLGWIERMVVLGHDTSHAGTFRIYQEAIHSPISALKCHE
jgi:hypothetical protein